LCDKKRRDEDGQPVDIAVPTSTAGSSA